MDGPDLAQELFRLASADNFRDVAGTGDGHPTRDGGRVRRGAFFRSNELQLTDEETLTVTGLGLTAVHDLRTDVEVEAHPDVVVPGAVWRHLDVTGIPMNDVVELADEEAAGALMERVYRAFVESPRARRAFGSLLRHLAHDDGPQLFHCTAGKDRTGWAAALLLHVAGVPEEVIVEDYLLTNDYTRSSRARYLTMAETALGADKVPVYERVLLASPGYLAVAQAAVAATYGDLDGYLAGGLGLDRATLARLRARLVG
ncbi:MAG: tyrosine-protein phosphatase [Nocardioides sp.]